MSEIHQKDLFLLLMAMFPTKVRKLGYNETSDNETLSTNRIFLGIFSLKSGKCRN